MVDIRGSELALMEVKSCSLSVLGKAQLRPFVTSSCMQAMQGRAAVRKPRLYGALS